MVILQVTADDLTVERTSGNLRFSKLQMVYQLLKLVVLQEQVVFTNIYVNRLNMMEIQVTSGLHHQCYLEVAA